MSALETMARERRLASEMDGLVERASRHHWTEAEVFDAAWPLLLDAAGAVAALASLHEDAGPPLEFTTAPRALGWPEPARALCALSCAAYRVFEGRAFLAYPFDVASVHLGGLVLELARPLETTAWTARARLVAAGVEVLDNHLAALVSSRRKQRAARELSEALQDVVLERGLRDALACLSRHVALCDVLLVSRQEAGLRSAPQTFTLVQHKGAGLRETSSEIDPRGAALLDHETPELLRALGLHDCERRDVLAVGRGGGVMAKLFVGSARGYFDAQEHDLLGLFVEFLRQRLTDFQREWRQLSRAFSPTHTARLLREPDYRARRLVPQERSVAALYADLAGFTRLCETVLGTPARIAALVDTFGEGAVAIVWEEGGVFDKMVGDCVIALFGPPFFEDDAATCCARALRAAERIRELARDLGRRVPALAGAETGVATGLNYCPMFVGLFGPDEAYTGFSAGMNNAARLQGLAVRHEILCTADFVAALGEAARFDEESGVRVKNVTEPLRYRRYRG